MASRPYARRSSTPRDLPWPSPPAPRPPPPVAPRHAPPAASAPRARRSAGLLVYRRRDADVEVFLVHPGGPFWRNKDDGAWSIPKGEYVDPEEPLAAAQREFAEETGMHVSGPFHALAPVRQAGGKLVHAWAAPGDFDANAIRSN